jgi:hypothetical protein
VSLPGFYVIIRTILRALSVMEKIVRKFHLSEDTEAADLAEYRVLTGNERLQVLLELIMPENPKTPLSNDLRDFIRLLNTKNVKYAIVGAWALAFHGRPRYTGDLDISWKRMRKTPRNFWMFWQHSGSALPVSKRTISCVPITSFSLDGRLTGSISLRE